MIGPVIVMKFGGSSVGDARSIRQVADLVRAELPRQPVVVVSAHAGVTDALLELARRAPLGAVEVGPIAARHREILTGLGLPADLLDPLLSELAELARGLRLVGGASPRAVDHLVSFGERCSARTVAAFLGRAGIPACPVDAYDLGLRTDSTFGRARPLPDDGRIAQALARLDGVPVVTGFIGKDEQGNITTLGRNGSDWSAALLGAAAGAAEIQVWKDVDGVRTADPRLVPAALPIRTMSFDEACELSSFGSKILHPATMLPAMARRIPVRVRNTRDPAAAGTLVVANAPEDRAAVRAIGHRADATLVTVSTDRTLPQHALLARVFEALAAREVDVGPVAISEGSVRFACTEAETSVVAPVLQALGNVEVLADRAVVGIVGTGPTMADGIAADVLAALAGARIPVQGATLGARWGTLAVIVSTADLAGAVRVLHARFFE